MSEPGPSTVCRAERAKAYASEEECLARPEACVGPELNDFGVCYEANYLLQDAFRAGHSRVQVFCVEHPTRPRNRYTDSHRFNVNMMSAQQLKDHVPGLGALPFS